jgi:large subunit ribosomal protein L4
VKVAVYDTTAKEVGSEELDDSVFGIEPNIPVMHQAHVRQQANARLGTHDTKTRKFVSGGGRKPWRQKGTGRARHGSTRSPIWRGGGIVFGPQPRDYTTDVPKKVKQLARRSALNARAREDALLVIDRLAFDAPKTAQLAGLLRDLGVAGRKVLVLTFEHSPNAYLSGRNLQNVRVARYAEVSAYDVLWSDVVLVEQGAITGEAPEVEETAGDGTGRQGTAGRAAKKTAKAPAARKAAPKKAAPKKAAKKAAAKPAAKKPAARKTKETE